MTNLPALDVAIGLSFAYFLFSVLATTVTETISRLMKMRARTLEDWLNAVFTDKDSSVKSYERFLGTPIIKALIKAVDPPVTSPIQAQHRGRITRRVLNLVSRPAGDPERTRPPAYIPSPQFVAAALSAGREAKKAGAKAGDAWTAIGKDVAGLKGTLVGDSLQELYDRASGDAARFRQDAEAWFDDHMERLSGAYRRWSQRIVWITAAVLVVVLNANTFRIAETLWNDPSKRAAIVAKAGTPGSPDDPSSAISDLALPLGWTDSYHGFGWLWMLVGMVITLGAVSLGAPFWFDVLSRFSRVRQAGTPPPAANATRGGDGDQNRQSPDVAGWKPELKEPS
jgi:hypothetical protein